MYAFRAIHARRIVLTDGFFSSRDDAALQGRQGNLHQMYLQQNCLYNVARRARHTAVSTVSWSCSICTTEQRREPPDCSALEKGDAACASQLCTHRPDLLFF